MTGRVSPLITNWELFELAAVTVTLAPLAVRDPEPVPLSPTCTLPRLSVAGLAVRVPGVAVPVPDKGIVNVGFEAVEVIVTLPLAAPVAVGANLTESVADCPADRVIGVVMPLTLNTVPLAETCEIVIEVAPVLVSLSVKVELLPTTILPKLRLVGVAVNAPGATPVPVSAIVNVGFEALDVIVTVPVRAPLVVGANETVNVVFCDGFTVSGVVIPLSLNPVPLMLACETLTAVPPVLLRVTVTAAVEPVSTFPKSSLAGLSAS